MIKKRLVLYMFILLLLVGCQIGKDKLPSEMDPKDLPEGRAFEDEFTRGLLQSTEEVLPGYYPFLAKNGRWEMAFPENGLTGIRSYISKHNTESIMFTDWEEGKNTSAIVDVKFYSYFKTGDIETKQESLRSSTGYSLEFEEVVGEDQTYYIAPFEETVTEGKNKERYGYTAYVQKETEAGGIFVIYTINCKAKCEETKEAELEEVRDWLLTIQFLDEEVEES